MNYVVQFMPNIPSSLGTSSSQCCVIQFTDTYQSSAMFREEPRGKQLVTGVVVKNLSSRNATRSEECYNTIIY